MDAEHKDFKATPMSHFKPVKFSDEAAHSAGKKMKSDKPWMPATSPKASGLNDPDEALPAIPANGTSSHPSIKAKEEVLSPAYGEGAPMLGQPESGAATQSRAVKNEMPKKWLKKGYSMNVPSSLPDAGADGLKSKWEQ